MIGVEVADGLGGRVVALGTRTTRPHMPNTIFALLLGALVVYAVYAAVKAGSGRPRMGWGVIALAAAVQVMNLVTQYSFILAIITTIGLLAGIWLIRSPAQPAVHR